MVDAKFRNSFTYWLHVAEQARLQSHNPLGDAFGRSGIRQAIEPFPKMTVWRTSITV